MNRVVRVYTTGPSCMQCVMTKKRLTKLGVPFEEILVDPTNENDVNAAALRYMGFQGAPVVLVSGPDGETSWVGFSPDRIDALAVT